jgi:hypothetical protein
MRLFYAGLLLNVLLDSSTSLYRHSLFIYPPVKYHYQLHMQLQCITVKYEASSETAERY